MFTVDPGRLSGLAPALERLGEDALAGRKYVQDNTALTDGEGWLNQLSGAHQVVVTHTRDWLRELYDPATLRFAGSVAHAIERYRTTDEEQAAHLDAAQPSYASLADPPTHTRELYVGYGARTLFSEAFAPQERYQPVPDYDADPAFRYHPQATDVLSVAGAGRMIVIKATELMRDLGWLDRPYDPYEIAVKPVTGDWAGYRGTADVLRNVAEALTAMAENLSHYRLCLDECWHGNAATACGVHIDRLRRTLREAEAPLRTMADRYEEAAYGQAEFRSAIETLLGDLIDASLVLVAAIAAGTATSWTGVGAAAGATIAGIEAYTIVRCLMAMIDWYDRAQAIVDTVDSAMKSFGQLDASDYQLPRLPAVHGGHSTLHALPS